MDKERVRILLEKFRAGTLTDDDRAILESWYLHRASDPHDDLDDRELAENLLRIERRVIAQTKPRAYRMPYIWGAAAAVVVIASVAVWYFSGMTEQGYGRYEVTNQQDVQPGGNRATLTLANGRVVVLDEEQAGIVMGGELTYRDGTPVAVNREPVAMANPDGTPTIHTLTIPKGGQYQLELPDGSQVWLNAGSTLRFSSDFNQRDRLVELEGEAYFEVKKLGGTERRPAIPFKVKTNGQEITVLGTGFNVTAYGEDQLVKTTLVHGSVEINCGTGGDIVKLMPGQESIRSSTGITVADVDVAVATAWKTGKFRFNETELHEVMRQLSRWYDLEIEYQGVIPERYFYGVFSRDKPLSEVLDVLKESEVNFEIKQLSSGYKLIVKH